MMGFSWIKIGGALAALAAIITVGWLVRDRFAQQELAQAADKCATASLSATDDLTDCLPVVRAKIEAARRAASCDAALSPRLTNGTRHDAQQSCSSGVKRLIAVGDAAEREIAGLNAEITEARASIGEAIGRAERRAATTQTRRDHASEVIETAPRGDDGRITCDADCLRELSQ